MAEFVFRDLAEKHGLEVEVASAATSSWEHGNPVHNGTQRELAKHGLKTNGKTSRQINQDDFYYYDYIIGMDLENVRDLRQIQPKNSSAIVTNFLKNVEEHENDSVPDPYYTGDFEETYRLVKMGSLGWIEKLEMVGVREEKGNLN